LPGRKWSPASTDKYRFGFNGKEKDDEVNGDGNSMDFGARINDTRLGRWLSLDPLQAKYPDLSPYNSVGNNPIVFIDPNGKKIDKSQLSRQEKREYRAIIRQLKKSDVFKEMYKQLKHSDDVITIKLDNKRVGGQYEESTKGGKLTKTVTIGTNSEFTITYTIAQELFHSYQRISENAELYKSYKGGDYEAEGEVATFFMMKQIGKTYDPLGGSTPSVVDGKFKLTISDIFARNEATKEGISNEQFNSDYQNYKKDLNEHFKTRLETDRGYADKIDQFTDSKAAGLEKIVNGDKKQEVNKPNSNN
jgi:RHS repeat-associated protein